MDLIAFGQNGEDIVLHRAFRDSQPGYYVDLGAGHPTFGSITRNLYHQLKWRGLEVEPIPELAKLLAEDRPHCRVAAAAAGTAEGEFTFYECTSSWALSTTDAQIHREHIASGHEFEEHQTAVLPINELLEQNDVPTDFEVLKSDIEGMDLEVLASLDWNRWRPKVVVVETIEPGSLKRADAEITALLEKNRYGLELFDGINSFYVLRTEPEIARQIAIPFNKLDFAIPMRWWLRLEEAVRKQYPHLLQPEECV